MGDTVQIGDTNGPHLEPSRACDLECAVTLLAHVFSELALISSLKTHQCIEFQGRCLVLSCHLITVRQPAHYFLDFMAPTLINSPLPLFHPSFDHSVHRPIHRITLRLSKTHQHQGQ